jgi:hypothetical protein
MGAIEVEALYTQVNSKVGLKQGLKKIKSSANSFDLTPFCSPKVTR